MNTYFEIPLEQEAFIYMIRDKCYKQFGAPIDCRCHEVDGQEVFRTDDIKFAEVAKEITGLDWIEKEYPKPAEQPANYKGFTWGT